MTGAFAFGKLTPGRHRMATTAGSSFATAHGVVNRVLHNTADVGTEPKIPLLTGFTERGIHVVEITDLTDGGAAIQMDLTDFSGGHLDLSIISVLGTEESHLTGSAGNHAAFAGDKFDIVNFDTIRNVPEFDTVTGFDLSFVRRDHSLTDLHTVGSKDVALGAVFILDKSNEAGTVGVILDVLNGCGHIKFGTLEVDHTVSALVASPAETDRDAAHIVSSAGRFLTLGKALFRRLTRNFRVIQDLDKTTTLGRGFVGFDRHNISLGDVDGSLSESNDRFLPIGAFAGNG